MTIGSIIAISSIILYIIVTVFVIILSIKTHTRNKNKEITMSRYYEKMLNHFEDQQAHNKIIEQYLYKLEKKVQERLKK